MDFDIDPNVGVRGLALGSSKEVVRRFFGTEPKVFQRSPGDNPADYWAEGGVFAYYDSAGNLEALEFALPAEAALHGTVLTEASMMDATAFLSSLDPTIDIDEGGASVRSHRLGVGLWCPTPDEPGAAVQSVLICGPGYFV